MSGSELNPNKNAKIKPRSPLIMRNVPNLYYEDHQLAGVIQAIEAALFSICFRQYPQAFLTLYSGIEKLCKNVSGQGKDSPAWKSWQAAGEKLELNNHEIFEKTSDSNRYKFQFEWATLRNEIEHQGDSPSYDAPAARLLLGSLWDAYQLIFDRAYGFNVIDSLLPNTASIIKCSVATLRRMEIDMPIIEKVYFMNPLVCHIRNLMSPTFFSIEDFMDYSGGDQHWNHMNSWQEFIKNSRSDLEWDNLECPSCESNYSLFGFRVEGGKIIEINFSIFYCPECNLKVHNHEIEPYLAQELFSQKLKRKIPTLAGRYREANAQLVW